jgi:formate dehydrogenase subunit delta
MNQQSLSASAAADSTVLEMERLLTMAGQIGDFFAPYPPERAAEGVRNHLRSYWEPRMRAALLAHIEAGAHGLAPQVVAGARLLQDEAAAKKSYYGPPKA